MVDGGGRGLEAGGGEEAGLQGEAERAADEGASGGAEGQEDLGLEEEEERETQGDEDSGWRRASSLDELFEEELMAQLEEYEQVIEEFHVELDATRARHALATGRVRGDAEGPPPCPSERGPCPQPARPCGSSPSPRHLSCPPRLTQAPSCLYDDKWISKNPKRSRRTRRTRRCARSSGSASSSCRP